MNNNVYSNYLQFDVIYNAFHTYSTSIDDKDDSQYLTNFYQYLRNNNNNNLISICQHIINNQNIYYYFDKFNSPWMKPQMNFIEWIKHCSHPCPVITISKNNNRINNFDIKEFDVSMLQNQFTLIPNLRFIVPQIAYIAKSNAGFIQFQHNIDQYILREKKSDNDDDDDDDEIRFISRKLLNGITLEKIVNNLNITSTTSNKQNCYYYLNYSNILCNNKFDLNLLIQVSPITERTLLKGSKIKGSKFKFQIIQPQSIWDSTEITEKITHYKISRYLTKFVIKSGNCIWNQHYYYQYPINYAKDVNNSHISYAYINYCPRKPIESVNKYYSKLSKVNKHHHNKLFKYFCERIGMIYHESHCNPLTSHLFWIGATVHNNVITKEWKDLMYKKIHSWKTEGVPEGIHCDKGNVKKPKLDIRWKFFIGYKYAYRLNKNISTTDINKANLKAGGLRNIENCCEIPQWLKKLIIHLKKIRFIDPNVEINQIGINYYFNNKTKPIYNSIDPHLEDEKFSVVYSISIYKNPKSPTCLSFGLNLNYSCGDTKIIMNDCDGIKLESVFIYIFIYIYLYYYYYYMLLWYCIIIILNSTKLVHEHCDSFCIKVRFPTITR